MSDRTIILELAEEALESGRAAEEVCVDHPELIAAVRLRLTRLKQVEAGLDALFPEERSKQLEERVPRSLHALPSIPGHEMESLLGRGGMGVVYRARNIRLNRSVAVKMLLTGLFAGPRERARFQRESEALAELRHPNIVHIYEAGELDEMPYFTMEFVEGGTLAEKLSGAPLSAEKAASLVATLAAAVQAAHDKGIVHRDLKPGNILLTLEDSPKVSDFGLARKWDSKAEITRTGARVGTPSYMAPEQAAGDSGAIGPAVDVYALGAILYELLTGRPPFRAETAQETERQVLAEEPAPPSRLNARVPRDLETICLKCLRKDPVRRYASAVDLAEDLARFQRGEPIVARPIGSAERITKWVRRNPGRATLLLAVAVAAIALLLAGWWVLEERGERDAKQAAEDAEQAERDRTVQIDLQAAEKALEESDWPRARSALESAGLRLRDHGPEELRSRLDQARRNLQLSMRLDQIFVDYTSSDGRGIVSGFDHTRADKEFEAAVREAGIGAPDEPPQIVAERIRASGIRQAIIGAFDFWSLCIRDMPRAKWVQNVAALADVGASEWRQNVRIPKSRDPKLLAELVRTAPLDRQSIPLHLALAGRTNLARADQLDLLRRLRAAHPDDFWTTFMLAVELNRANDPDAIAYYEAAISIRPQSFAAHLNLGTVLLDHGRVVEAGMQRELSVRLFADKPLAHYNLGLQYYEVGQLERAVSEVREAIRLNPEYGDGRAFLSRLLLDQGKFEEARTEARRSLANPATRSGPRDLADKIIVRCNIMQPLEPRLPEIVSGRLKPADANGGIDFALLCDCKEYYAKAAELYRNAFAASPALDKAGDYYRFLALKAAMRAGSGAGRDSPPEGLQRAEFRNQALQWLYADQSALANLLTGGTSPERRRALRDLRRWQLEPAFAPLRDKAALAKLNTDERRRWQNFWDGLDDQLNNGTLPPLSSATTFAARGEWKQAAEAYDRLIQFNRTDLFHAWYECAATQLLAGDREGYERTCRRLADRYPGTLRVRSYHVARACTLASVSPEVLATATQLSLKELNQQPAEYWSLTQQAALLHRAGESNKAIPLLEFSLAADSRPGIQVVNWLWLSLAYQKLDRDETARLWLSKATEWLDQFKGELPVGAETKFGLHFHNWLEAQVLRKEAEALLR